MPRRLVLEYQYQNQDKPWSLEKCNFQVQHLFRMCFGNVHGCFPPKPLLRSQARCLNSFKLHVFGVLVGIVCTWDRSGWTDVVGTGICVRQCPLLFVAQETLQTDCWSATWLFASKPFLYQKQCAHHVARTAFLAWFLTLSDWHLNISSPFIEIHRRR